MRAIWLFVSFVFCSRRGLLCPLSASVFTFSNFNDCKVGVCSAAYETDWGHLLGRPSALVRRRSACVLFVPATRRCPS